MGVGIAESGCSPPAHSLISDYFAPSQRASALSIYSCGTSLGYLLAAVAGGYVAQHWGWRAACASVGVPGIGIALLIKAAVREPPRGLAAPSSGPPFSFRAEWHELLAGGARAHSRPTDSAHGPRSHRRRLRRLWLLRLHSAVLQRTYGWTTRPLESSPDSPEEWRWEWESWQEDSSRISRPSQRTLVRAGPRESAASSPCRCIYPPCYSQTGGRPAGCSPWQAFFNTPPRTDLRRHTKCGRRKTTSHGDGPVVYLFECICAGWRPAIHGVGHRSIRGGSLQRLRIPRFFCRQLSGRRGAADGRSTHAVCVS